MPPSPGLNLTDSQQHHTTSLQSFAFRIMTSHVCLLRIGLSPHVPATTVENIRAHQICRTMLHPSRLLAITAKTFIHPSSTSITLPPNRHQYSTAFASSHPKLPLSQVLFRPVPILAGTLWLAFGACQLVMHRSFFVSAAPCRSWGSEGLFIK